MKKSTIIFLAAGFVFLLAAPAFALDMEYYTYGGFNPIVQAFNKIALIFSDSGYQGLLFVIMVLGLIAGVTAWLARAATGARVIPMVWAVPVFFGAILYLAMFVPKGNITVYDPVLNRFQTIGNIPDAVVFTAGFLNKIERGMVDIIDTAAAPSTDYQTTAGGIGFKALRSIRGSYPKDNFASTSMIRYIKDCVTFELVRPGTTLTLDDLRNNSTDFLTELAQAVNPSVFTVYYEAAAPEGATMSCSAAWANLLPIYNNPSNYSDALKKACSKAYFDPSSTVEMNTCKTLISNSLTFTTGSTATPEKLIQQQQIAGMLYERYFTGDAESSALMESNKRITTTGMGIGLTMNEWIPIIRAIMTSIAIGVIPFLVLFLPTPVMGKAISVMFGFFVFLTTWGITDAVIHGAAMDYANYAFEDMRQSNLGVYGMAALPSLSQKMLSMFGVIRSAGIMLASFFSMMLIKFGGHALAMLAGNLSSIVQSSGAHAGRNFTPEGSAAAMNEQIKAAGLLSGIPEHRFANMAGAGAFSLHRNVGGYNAAMKAEAAQIKAGQLPANTTDGQMAEAMASSAVRIATSTGTSTTSLSANGAGTATDTVAGGSATYAVGSGGQHSLTRATVNNIDPVKMAEMKSHQSIVSASNSLGSSSNWSNLQQQLQKSGLTDSHAQTYANRLSNSTASSWSRSFKNDSSFVHTMDQATRTQFQAAVDGGFKNIGLSGRGQITVVGQDNEKVSFNVSENTARAFSSNQQSVRSEAIQDTFGDSQGLEYMTNMSKQIGASEAYSYLNDARETKGSSTSYGIDVMTGLVGSYAVNRYGSDSPENIRSSINALNDMVTNQGTQGKQNFNDIASSYLSNQGFFGNTTSSVHSSMRTNRAMVQGQDILKGAVNQAAGNAAGATSSVTAGSVSAPLDSPNPSLDKVDGSKTLHDANMLRDQNRREEAGKGRIQTTAPGMIKEGIGNTTTGVVDSQGDRLTTDGYFDEPKFTYAKGVNVKSAGPIPKDAPSTISGKK